MRRAQVEPHRGGQAVARLAVQEAEERPERGPRIARRRRRGASGGAARGRGAAPRPCSSPARSRGTSPYCSSSANAPRYDQATPPPPPHTSTSAFSQTSRSSALRGEPPGERVEQAGAPRARRARGVRARAGRVRGAKPRGAASAAAERERARPGTGRGAPRRRGRRRRGSGSGRAARGSARSAAPPPPRRTGTPATDDGPDERRLGVLEGADERALRRRLASSAATADSTRGAPRERARRAGALHDRVEGLPDRLR